MPPSTTSPEALPDIESLRCLTKALAMLDAILCPNWESRYYSYNAEWGKGEEMASMRNGYGDDWFLLFDGNGAALKGFAHEYPLAGDSAFALCLQKEVPAVFGSFLREPAFTMDRATFCLWRRRSDFYWSVVSPPGRKPSSDLDGSAELLGILDGKPESYRNWAVDYYERELSVVAVEAIYRHQPLNDRLIAMLNPDISLSDVRADAEEIGYPGALPR